MLRVVSGSDQTLRDLQTPADRHDQFSAIVESCPPPLIFDEGLGTPASLSSVPSLARMTPESRRHNIAQCVVKALDRPQLSKQIPERRAIKRYAEMPDSFGILRRGSLKVGDA